MFFQSNPSVATRFFTLIIAILCSVSMNAQIVAYPANNGPVINNPAPAPSFPGTTAPYFSYKAATCPMNASSCSDSQLRYIMDFTATSAQPIMVARSFVVLADLNPGDASWLQVTVENGYDDIALQTHREVFSPGQHNLYESNMWLLRIDVTDLVNRGLYLQPNGELTLHFIGATADGTNVREDLRFKVSN